MGMMDQLLVITVTVNYETKVSLVTIQNSFFVML